MGFSSLHMLIYFTNLSAYGEDGVLALVADDAHHHVGEVSGEQFAAHEPLRGIAQLRPRRLRTQLQESQR